MANFNVTTKVIIIDAADARADSVSGSAAEAITAYLETVTDTKTIRAIQVSALSNSRAIVIIIHDS